jgi:hypothetical protein
LLTACLPDDPGTARPPRSRQCEDPERLGESESGCNRTTGGGAAEEEETAGVLQRHHLGHSLYHIQPPAFQRWHGFVTDHRASLLRRLPEIRRQLLPTQAYSSVRGVEPHRHSCRHRSTHKRRRPTPEHMEEEPGPGSVFTDQNPSIVAHQTFLHKTWSIPLTSSVPSLVHLGRFHHRRRAALARVQRGR